MKLLQAIFVGAVALMINHSVVAASNKCENMTDDYEFLWESLDQQGRKLDAQRRLQSKKEKALHDSRLKINNLCIVGVTDLLPVVRDQKRKDCRRYRTDYDRLHADVLTQHAEVIHLRDIFMADLIRWEGLGRQLELGCSGDGVGNGDNVATCGRTKKGIIMVEADMKYNQRVNPAGYACNVGKKACWKCPKGSSWGRGEVREDDKGRTVQYCGKEDDVPDCG